MKTISFKEFIRNQLELYMDDKFDNKKRTRIRKAAYLADILYLIYTRKCLTPADVKDLMNIEKTESGVRKDFEFLIKGFNTPFLKKIRSNSDKNRGRSNILYNKVAYEIYGSWIDLYNSWLNRGPKTSDELNDEFGRIMGSREPVIQIAHQNFISNSKQTDEQEY
jgi:hypothetical protein